MKIVQIAKYYFPLRSAQAYQATKLTHVISNNKDIKLFSIVGSSSFDKIFKKKDIKYINYSYDFISHQIFRKLNRLIKEINQINPFNKWVRKVSIVLEKEIKNDNKLILFTQSTPFECHFLGLIFKKKNNLKWVAAFSDPFPIGIAPKPYKNANKIPFLSFFQKIALKKVLLNADKVLVSSFEAYKIMCQFANVKTKKNYHVIPHIGNRSVISEIKNGWIVHTGNLTKERETFELISAVKELENLKNFNGIIFIGKVRDEFKSKIDKMGLSDFFKFKVEVEQSSINTIIKDCSALLVIEADMPYSPFLPSKFADYATSGKPIISLSPKMSPISSYINQFGGGIVCSFNSLEIKKAIIKVINGEIIASKKLMYHFSDENVSSIYKEIFEDL